MIDYIAGGKNLHDVIYLHNISVAFFLTLTVLAYFYQNDVAILNIALKAALSDPRQILTAESLFHLKSPICFQNI